MCEPQPDPEPIPEPESLLRQLFADSADFADAAAGSERVLRELLADAAADSGADFFAPARKWYRHRDCRRSSSLHEESH